MGRRKIVIQPLEDERNRSVTFLKRRAGLFKKAHELSVLCQVDIAVIVFGANQKLYEFSSTDTNQLIQRYQKSIPYEKKTPEDYNGKKRAGGHRATGSVSSIKSEPTDDDVDFEDDDDSKNVSQNATPQMPSNVTPQMAQSVTPQMPQNVTPQQMPPQQQLTPQQQQQQQMPHPHHPEQQRYYDYMSMGQMGQHPHQQQIMQQQMMQQQQHHHQMQQQAQHQHHQQQQQQQQQHQNQHHKSQFTPISQEMSSLAGHLLDIRRGTNDIPPSSIPATAGSMGQGVAGAGSGYIPGSEGSSRVSSRQNSVTRPKLKVQIPGEKRGSTGGNAGPGGGGGQAGNSRSTSGEGTPVDAKEENTSHAALLLPPPSPSSYINNSGVGPGNPFAKPTLLNGEQTPLSAALPSRYINDLLPSPSNFYGTEWNFNPGSAGGSSFSAGGSLIPTSACKDKKRVDNSDDKLGVKKQRLG